MIGARALYVPSRMVVLGVSAARIVRRLTSPLAFWFGLLQATPVTLRWLPLQGTACLGSLTAASMSVQPAPACCFKRQCIRMTHTFDTQCLKKPPLSVTSSTHLTLIDNSSQGPVCARQLALSQRCVLHAKARLLLSLATPFVWLSLAFYSAASQLVICLLWARC